jgi:putative ABC transport system permease protein
MLTPSRLLRRLRYLLTRRRHHADVDDELRFHLEMEVAKHRATGLDERTARQRALRDFGSVARVREETRDAHGVRPLEDLARDVRIGLRGLARQRAFATVSILTLAIGIGGTTAVFGAVYGILLAPLPYAEQDRIVTVWQRNTRAGSALVEVSPGNFLDWRGRVRSFEHFAIAEPWSLDYIGPAGPDRLTTAAVTEGFFEALGARPLLGRTFLTEEFAAGRNGAVVLSEAAWRARFSADTSLVGRTLILDSVPMTVIGVMPRAVEVPYAPQAWIPKIFRPDEREDRSGAYYTSVARLRDGVTVDAARHELSALAAQSAREHPTTNASTGIALVPLAESLVGQTRSGLYVLLGAVGFVLLIACANVASLQLAQSVRRRRELAVRAAIGAGRGRLARQLFAECVLLGVIGGAAGVALAHWGIAAIRSLAPRDLPRLDELGTSPAVLLFALAVSVATALIFGLAPALEAGRLRLTETLAAGGRTATGTRMRRRALNGLVVGVFALALVLLVGTGLLTRSLTSLLRVERGFRTDHMLVVTLQAWSYYPTGTQRVAFVRDAMTRLSAVPGVRSAGMTSSLPLSYPIGQARSRVTIEGQPMTGSVEPPSIHVAAATRGYFETLAIPLRMGRLPDATDQATSMPIAVVNESFARRFFAGESPLGKRITFGFMGPPVTREIVGVVGDVRHDGLAEVPRASLFVPHEQAPTGAMHFVLRTAPEPVGLQGAVRAELARINGAMPLSEMTTLDTLLDTSLRERRFHLALIGAFSIIALLLAAIGIYGLMSNATSERTAEMGVRVAMGARRVDVIGLVVSQGVKLALTGIGLGLVGAWALTRLIRGMLYSVTPLDPPAFAAAVAALLAAALLACWIPARRAAAVDPVEALNS